MRNSQEVSDEVEMCAVCKVLDSPHSWLPATQLHHVIPRRDGGPGGSNLMPICQPHHRRIHGNEAWAVTMGFLNVG